MRQDVIAVENGLTPVEAALRERGHQVVLMKQGDTPDAAVLVVTGGDENMLGIQNVELKAPVVVAEGRSVVEICDAVEEKLEKRR